MPTFKITYLTTSCEEKVCYETADHGAEAQQYAFEDYPDLDRVVFCDQITPSE